MDPMLETADLTPFGQAWTLHSTRVPTPHGIVACAQLVTNRSVNTRPVIGSPITSQAAARAADNLSM